MRLVQRPRDEVLDNIEILLDSLQKQKVYLHPKDGEPEPGDIIKPTLLVANKSDVDDSADILEMIVEYYSGKFTIVAVSSISEEGLTELAQKIFAMLNLVRIYSKPPGKKADLSSPILLKKGSTVIDLAKDIHSDLAQRLKSARIWGSKDFIDGQRVPLDYQIVDEDIIELNTE